MVPKLREALLVQVLLRGANTEELKKVKKVVQFAVFAAYHLALETSFLADEGATLSELPGSLITVVPSQESTLERSEFSASSTSGRGLVSCSPFLLGELSFLHLFAT